MFTQRGPYLGLAALLTASLGMLTGWSSTVHATDTDTLAVSAEVVGACQVSASPLVFGNYTQGGSSLDLDTQVSVTCSDTSAWTLDFNTGLYATGNTRRMKRGMNEDYLQYNLYLDSTHLQILGAGFMGGANITGNGSQPNTVYGRIPAGQIPAAGSYTDSIVVTLTP